MILRNHVMDITPRESHASKTVTIQDLADTLGIHKSTVSIALSGKGRISDSMRTRVLTLADQLGYEPDPLAQRLANRSKSNVVCLCSGELGPGRGTEKIALLQGILTGLGLEVPIYTPAKSTNLSGEEQAALFRQTRRQRPQAVVLSVYALRDEIYDELRAYQQEGGIVVSYDLPIPLKCDQVLFDREQNAYEGARFLLERGHRNIGISVSRLVRPLSDNHNTTQNLRLKGFQRALAEFDCPLREDWIFENRSFERGGAELAQSFLALKDRPTALCIVNDYVALAFMVEVMKAGVRVPEDVSIVGHDDQPVASYCPVPLTSVSQPAGDIVKAVVERVKARLKGDHSAPRTETIHGTLIERQSVAAKSGSSTVIQL